MGKKIFIAGHGKKRNGTFDSGAINSFGIGEHKYFSDYIFPMMRKLSDDKDLVLFSDYNVFDYGNIVSLAKSYGSDSQVIELHFDSAGNVSAKGGHIIISNSFKPDSFDLNLVKMIGNTIGIRTSYKHAGVVGLSGRNDLGNVNRCRDGGVAYRLVELGFGSNKNDTDYMMNNIELISTELLKCFDIELKHINNKPVENNILYKVQVGAFAVKQNVINLQNELKKIGYDCFVVEGVDKLYRVQVGAFAVKQNTINLQNELKKKGYDCFIVEGNK